MTVRRTKEKIISDLIWTRDSAPIYLGGDIPELQKFLNRLSQIQVSKFELEIDDNRWFSGRVGRYFESLLGVLLKDDPSILNLEKNVVVKNKKLTVGEFDFLCERDSDILHFEIAVKFFLKAELNGVHDFWGPRKKDSLSSKIARIREHQLQLPLPERWAAKNKPLKRLALMKGILFYPWSEFSEKKFEFPADVYTEHQKGWWIPRRAVDSIVGAGIEFLCPGKLDWLSFDSMQDSPKWTEVELRDFLLRADVLSENYKEAVLIVRIDGNGREIDRGFIVNDFW